MTKVESEDIRAFTRQVRNRRRSGRRAGTGSFICALALCLALGAAAHVEAQTYLSYFYTPSDVIVFMPELGTAATLRNQSGTVVWQELATLNTGEVGEITGLGAGWYRVTSNKKIVVMAGDMISGSDTSTRSYYARDVDGKAVGTELYSYIKDSTDSNTPKLFVFSHQASNAVTVWHRGEFGWVTEWTGTLGEGSRQDIAMTYDDPIRITSTYPVSALMAGSIHYDNPGAHCVPATSSGTFYGDRFKTWIPGGEVYVYAFADDTEVDLYNTFTIDPTPRWTWDLDEGEVGSYGIPFNKPFAISVLANKPILMCRMYQDLLGEYGMHYIPAKSGTMIGTDFIIDANDTNEVIAYEDGTSFEYTRLNGTVHSYTLNAGQHQALLPDTAGRVVAQKAVSIVSRSLIGATFVPIPVTSLDTAPGPPAVFAVQHYPPLPTVNDSSVAVSWATDEPCTSSMYYRVNGGFWMINLPGMQPYATQHSMSIDISTLAANDLVEYYVSATDKDNNQVTNTNGGQYYSFSITDNIPQLSVGRLSAWPPGTNDDAYTVNLMVQNTGIAEARNIVIRERITGMISPTAATSTVPISSREVELSIPVANLAPGGFTTVSYELIPMLYGTYSSFGVGLFTQSTVSYRSPAGKTFNENFSDPHAFSSSGALNWIRGKDYVVATNIMRLRSLNTPAAAGTVLEEAARFALARDAVVAELETTDRYAIEKLINSSWNGRLGSIGYGGWRFLAFLGCQGVVPTFSMRHKCTWESARLAPIADNIYADVNTGDDYKPEVIIGRFPGESANRLVSQLQNSLTPMSTDRAVFMSGTGNGQDDYVDCINGIEGWLGQYTTRVKRHWKDLAQNQRLPTLLADAPNTDLFIYRDHGLKPSWGWNSEVTAGNTSTINFGSKHPMVWSIACLTGGIDANPSLAEAFLNRGASVFIGSTEVSPRGPNNDFAYYLTKYHFLSASFPTIGEVFKYAKRKVIDENIHWYTTCYEDARNKQLVNEYNLYGDPKRGETPLSKAAAAREAAEIGGEGPPPAEIDLTLPDYVVVPSEGGIDRVTFDVEEGGTFEMEGEPIVPIYIHRVAFGPEYKITAVSLVERSGLEEGEGLNLPLASFVDDDGASPTAPSATVEPDFFPPMRTQYAWRVEEELDGSHVLILTVFPFHYDSSTTAFEFYRGHVFDVSWNESDTSIVEIDPDEDVFALGDPVTGMIDIDHDSGQNIEAMFQVQLFDETSGEEVASTDPQGVGLVEGITSVDFGIPLDGDEPKTYLLRARITSGEDTLDEESVLVRVGIVSAMGEALAVNPAPAAGFSIGDLVTAAAWFENTCAHPLTGVARIRFADASGAVVYEHAEEVSLASGASQEVGAVWNTAAADEGDYLVTAVLDFDGLSTDPMTEEIFSLRDMGIELGTDQQVYDIGDKVVVWAAFEDHEGEPMQVTPTAYLAGTGLSPVQLELSYLSTLGIYSGWYFLGAGLSEGAYGIALTADAQGYETGNRQHFFSVGGEPPTPGFNWSPENPVVGQSVQFTDTSSGEPTTWGWSFGDEATSTVQNPTHTYAAPGDMGVTLMVTNTYGTTWVTQTVSVSGPSGPIFEDGFETGDCSQWSAEVP